MAQNLVYERDAAHVDCIERVGIETDLLRAKLKEIIIYQASPGTFAQLHGEAYKCSASETALGHLNHSDFNFGGSTIGQIKGYTCTRVWIRIFNVVVWRCSSDLASPHNAASRRTPQETSRPSTSEMSEIDLRHCNHSDLNFEGPI